MKSSAPTTCSPAPSATSTTCTATRASSSCATTSPSRCSWKSTKSTTWPARPRPIHYQHDPVQTTKTSVHGAINMLGLAKRLKIRILQASTSEVYGDPQVHPQTEDYWGNVNPIGPLLLRRRQALRRDAVLRLPPPAQAGDQGGAHLQHLRPAHAPQRRPRRLQLHRAGDHRRAAHRLRRRRADPLVLLRRRPDRRPRPPDGGGGRPSPARSTSATPTNSPSASWPRRSSP